MEFPAGWIWKNDNLKSSKEGKLVPSIQDWITLKIGKQFVEPHPFNLNDCFEDANITTSLIFVLSAGWDPVADFLRFQRKKDLQIDIKFLLDKVKVQTLKDL